MNTSIKMVFSHRHNEDGTYDSICRNCFMTLATEENEAKLRPYELAHVCNPLRIFSVTQDRAAISLVRCPN